MTPAEAIDVISRITYRPGWRLTAEHEPLSGSLVFHSGAEEPDAEDPSGVGMISVVYTSSIPPAELAKLDLHGLLRYVFDAVAKRALHEVEEWLRYEGRPVYEPHPQRQHRGILGDGTSTTLPEVR